MKIKKEMRVRLRRGILVDCPIEEVDGIRVLERLHQYDLRLVKADFCC